MRRARALTAILACACLPATAQATQSVKLDATLTPDRLGQGTTIGFGFQIDAPAGQVPSPLTELDVNYPGNLGIALSGVGLATCSPEKLKASGPGGCPANSRMGYGTALGEIQVGPEIIHENAQIALFRTANQSGHIALLIYATGLSPVDAQLVFPGLLLPAPAPFGGRLNINVPLVPSLPEAPDVAVVRVSSTLGPRTSSITNVSTAGRRPTTPRASSCPIAARAGASRSPPGSPSRTAATQPPTPRCRARAGSLDRTGEPDRRRTLRIGAVRPIP